MKNMDVLIDSNMILDVLQKSNCDDVKLFDRSAAHTKTAQITLVLFIF